MVFGEDPIAYLTARKIVVPSLENPKKPAVISKDLMARVNYEIFLLKDKKSLQKFQKDPLKSCGRLTDPVSHQQFQPGKKSPHTVFQGRPYYFSSDSTFVAFQAMPDSFAVRKGY